MKRTNIEASWEYIIVSKMRNELATVASTSYEHYYIDHITLIHINTMYQSTNAWQNMLKRRETKGTNKDVFIMRMLKN